MIKKENENKKDKTVFLFDLDSTVTTAEILPSIAKRINKEEEMQELTEKTMLGMLNFRESFLERVDILKNIPVSEVSQMISNIPLSSKIVEFIQRNKENCYIVTSNLDVWIIDLMKKINMENNFYSSKAEVNNNKIINVSHILPKEEVLKKFDAKIVAIGDGSNDRNMLNEADISIGYGGVRNIAPSLLEIVDYAIYDENKLCEFLNRLV